LYLLLFSVWHIICLIVDKSVFNPDWERAMKVQISAIALCAALGIGIGFTGSTARADETFSGTFYFTHYQGGGDNVWKDTYSYDQTTQTLTQGTVVGIAAVNGADGIIFDAHGHLLVGGQGQDVIHMLNQNGTSVDNEPLRDQSYHLALDPSGNFVYTSNFGGPLDIAPLTASGFGGAATLHSVTGGDTGLTQLAFDPKTGQTFYDNSQPNCCGSFGTINLSTYVTTQLRASETAVHGMTYDPFTGLITFIGDGYVGTYNPTSDPYLQNKINGADFDQGGLDGFGHALIAGSNEVTFIDYSISGDITNPNKVIVLNDPGFENIDDIAPLSGPGSHRSVPEPGTLALLAAALTSLVFVRRRKRTTT